MKPHDPPKNTTYFYDAVVEAGGQRYHFSIADGQALERAGNAWHGPGDPSTWLIVAVFWAARQRVGAAGDSVALALTAQALGITLEQVRAGITWHEQYMRWHDDDPDYRVL
jgi:hypothetical protein